MKNRSEVLREYASDMLATEKHTLESIEQQVRDSRLRYYKEAYELVTRIESVLRGHVFELGQYLSTLEGSGTESLLKKAASSAIGAMSGMYGRLRPEDPVSRDLRDDYAALCLAAVSYTMLHTTASSLNDSRLKELALRHLNELTPLIAALSRAIPVVLAQEFSREGKLADVSAGERALANTQRAWSSEVTGR